MIGTTVSVSQQYLLASKAKSKLLRCASTEKNKDYDLRILVGHANLLDRLMDSIDSFTHSQRQDDSCVEYLSSEEENEDEEEGDGYGDDYEYSESESESDSDSEDETFVDPPVVEHYGCTPRYSQSICFPTIWEEESDKGYVSLKLGCPSDYGDVDHRSNESDEDEDQESTDGSDIEQDLSLMAMTMSTDMAISV